MPLSLLLSPALHRSLVGSSLVPGLALGAFAALAPAPEARAQVEYLTSSASASALTTFDGQSDTRSSANFTAFVDTASLSTNFPLVGGGLGVNRATTGIDCQLDPNSVNVTGSMIGAGGVSLVAGVQAQQMGECAAAVDVNFRITALTDFSLIALPRDSARPTDRYKVKLKNDTTNQVLLDVSEDDPAQLVMLIGQLAPGDYALEYEVQLVVDNAQAERQFGLTLALPSPGAAAWGLAIGLGASRRRRR